MVDNMGMENIVIRDYCKLKKLLERIDDETREVYRHFLGDEPILAKVEYYKHPDGAKVEEFEGRYWVYVHLEGRSGMVYDLSLVKLAYTPLFKKLLLDSIVEIVDNKL
jgi:hypothetical protein